MACNSVNLKKNGIRVCEFKKNGIRVPELSYYSCITLWTNGKLRNWTQCKSLFTPECTSIDPRKETLNSSWANQ